MYNSNVPRYLGDYIADKPDENERKHPENRGIRVGFRPDNGDNR